MKNLILITLLTSIISTQTVLTMDNENQHDQTMKSNIEQILTIYSDSMQEFENASIDDSVSVNEYLRLAKIAKNLAQKYLPENTELEIIDKNSRITGIDFAINWLIQDTTPSSRK